MNEVGMETDNIKFCVSAVISAVYEIINWTVAYSGWVNKDMKTVKQII